MAGKFQIRSRAWNIGSVIGVIVLFLVGFGGLLLLQGSRTSGGTMLLFLLFLGFVTFLCFAGPGLLYSGRKRIKFLKDKLPGGTMAWIRSHMYLPILAIAAAFVHASSAPFRNNLTSGKVLLALGVLVVISGIYRHEMIGLQKEALNVDVEISKLSIGQPRGFRLVVAEFSEGKRPLAELEAEVAKMDQPQQVLWREVKRLSAGVEKNFPRAGGQKARVIQKKMWKALHPPLTIALFILLALHIGDTLGFKDALFHNDKAAFATATNCAGCHSRIVDEYETSAMNHAQSSLIMKAQLPVTLDRNRRLVDTLSGDAKDTQQERVDIASNSCVTCHAPVASAFTKDKFDLLPLDAKNSNGAQGKETDAAVSGANAAVVDEGVGCVACHTLSSAPTELQAAGFGLLPNPLRVDKQSGSDYGTVYGPFLTDPAALPVRVHTQKQDEKNNDTNPGKAPVEMWGPTSSDGTKLPSGQALKAGDLSQQVRESLVCGACHDVKVALGANKDNSPFKNSAINIDDPNARKDDDIDGRGIANNGQFNPNELNVGADGRLQDLVLQTTFDEWEDYLIGFKDAPFNSNKGFVNDPNPAAQGKARNTLQEPLGCIQCHMPQQKDQTVVDHAPGLSLAPTRESFSHTFVGADYDLDPKTYSKDQFADVLDERQALLESAVTLKVDATKAVPTGNGDFVWSSTVTVQNNLLGHAFPTGFAFARQFWLEVSAKAPNGQDVCLFKVFGGEGTNQPCQSGVIKNGQDDLPQCDPIEVAKRLKTLNGAADTDANNPAAKYPDAGIHFGETIKGHGSDPGQTTIANCDPWLANFQKILTDGTPGADGKLNEVAFQSFLPDIVKLRHRVADVVAADANKTLTGKSGLMAPLESSRHGDPATDGFDKSFTKLNYVFDRSGLNQDEVPTVSVTLHFRHLPPQFVRALADEQTKLVRKELPDEANITNPARLNEILGQLKNSSIFTVKSNDGANNGVPACVGPQNQSGASILTCVETNRKAGTNDAKLQGLAEGRSNAPAPTRIADQRDDIVADLRRDGWLFGATLGAFLGGSALLRRRLFGRRRRVPASS